MKNHSALKLVFALALAVVLCVTVMAVSAFAVDVDNQDDFYTTLTGAPAGVETVINITGDFSVTRTDYFIIPANAEVTITASEPHTVTYARSGSGYNFLRLTNSGSTLNITGEVTIRGNNNYNRGIIVGGTSATGNTLNLSGNAVIDNFRFGYAGLTDINGGQIYIYAGNTFNMTGGTVSNGKISRTGTKDDATMSKTTGYTNQGANVYNGGTFNMSGGTISGGQIGNRTGTVNFTNDCSAYTFYWYNRGANVYNKGTFVMSGGVIEGGEIIRDSYTAGVTGEGVMPKAVVASCGGAGLYCGAGTVTISGTAVIRNNTINSTTATNGKGGGVWIADGTLNLNGGTVSGNTSASFGGGVVVTGGTLNVTGGTISGNTAATYAGGMYTSRASSMTNVTISGNTANGRWFDPDKGTSANSAYAYGGGGLVLESNSWTLGSGVVIENNIAAANRGGGVVVRAGTTLDVDGATITGNQATDTNNGAGGGLFVYTCNTVNIKPGTTISNNTAYTNGGGVNSTWNSACTVNITGGTISNNTATSGFGGGVAINYCSFNMTGGTITGNSAGTSAGGMALSSSKGSSVTGGTISDNTSGTYAGGILVANAGTNTISGVTVTGNTAGSNGGAIYAGSAVVDLTVSDATITGNTATSLGGAFYAYGGKGITVEDTTVDDNRAGGNGGAFYGTSQSEYTVTGCTVTRNVSYGGGGAVLSSGKMTFDDTVLKGNACGVYYEGDTLKVRGAGWGGSAIYVDGSGNYSFKDVTITGNGNAGSAIFLSVPGSGKNTVTFDGVCVIHNNSTGVSSYDDVTGSYNIASNEKETGVGWTLGKSATTNFYVKDTISSASDVHISISFSKTSTDAFIGTVVDSSGDPSTTDISAALANFTTAGGLNLAQDGSNIVLDGTTPISYTIVSVNNGASESYTVLDIGVGITLPTQSELVSTFTDAPAAGSPFEGRAYSNSNFVGFADVTGYGTANPVLNAIYYTEQKEIPAADIDGKTLYAAWANAKTVPGASIKIAGDGTTSGIRFLTVLETDPMAAIGIKNLSETEWDNGDVGYVFGVTMTKDYGDAGAKSQTYQSAGGKLFTDAWFGDELYDASFDNRGTNHVFSFGLNLTSSQYEYEFTPTAFYKVQYTDGGVGNRTTPVPTEGDPAQTLVRTARGVARSYAAWLVSASNPDLDKDNLGLKPAQIGALEAIADGTFDLGNKTYANN